MKRVAGYLAVTFVLVLGGVIVVAQIDLTTFRAGDLIRAEEVNANFAALRDAVEGLEPLPADCAEGQIARFDGAAWSCAADAGSGGGGDADTLDGFDSTDFAPAAHDHDDRYYTRGEVDALVASPLDLFPMVGNGVGGSDCAGAELEVLIFDARGDPADYRFTFVTPGPDGGYGQVRSDASLRAASSNVSGATRAGPGSYCVAFATFPGQDAIESTVVGLATN